MEDLIKLGFYLLMLVVMLLSEFCGVFVNESEAINALHTQSFADVRITDKSIVFLGFRGCSSADAAKFDATATNARGDKVNVMVCVGWPFKGATVRSY